MCSQEIFESNDSFNDQVQSLLERGEQCIRNSSLEGATDKPGGATERLRQSLDELSARWDSVKLRWIEHANRLTTACDEARQMHDILTQLMTWLTETEQTLNTLQPVSRIMTHISQQIDTQQVAHGSQSAAS